MAGGKAQIPAPIDRPLSRAYLREFSGWSTAYPPGLSQPTSLRIMENVQINRDGSARVRPGLRHLSYGDFGAALARPLVGTHEAFFLNDGTKAYLFAVRETDNTIGFRVLKTGASPVVCTLLEAGFDLPVEPNTLRFSAATTYVKYLQIDNKIFALSNAGEPMRMFFVGSTKSAKALASITRPGWTVGDKLSVVHPPQDWINGARGLPPTANQRTVDTLRSSNRKENVYTFSFFYTFSNEVGESAASMVSTVRTQRPWSAWAWEKPNAAGEPNGTDTEDPDESADQLVATIPPAVWDAAIAQGATAWSLYMFTWSDQDPVPVTAIKVGTKTLDESSNRSNDGWLAVTPAMTNIGTEVAVLPTKANRYNYSNPSRAGQGLVAADRMVLVYDPTSQAVIRWSSNQQGSYFDFTASKGGGYKTLTSGNLMIPAAVKLWQNPSSADTLTILCMGTDGHSTGYYMAPAQVASQSEATNIMGFEETTATPGTSSPYGVEVFNNALYHPLDDQLMKSTATNYNINHKSQTDQIRDVWEKLVDKHHIVSCLHDNRLYYVVHNPAGAALEAGCWGNEIWVLDGGAENGTWSRWMIQAQSLRKIEQGGRIYLSVVRPDGIFYLDPEYGLDDVVGADRSISTRPIAWKLETNTQGANRAHDAWAHVQQLNIVLGYFQGSMRYGIRAWDIHGQPVDISKVVHDKAPAGELAFDLADNLLVRRDLQEWFFYAESLEDEPSFGQLNLVQYRYTPSTVNTGYEYGSVETFEYGRAAAGSTSTTTNGTPLPMIDARRP